jgi:ribonuclease R
MHRLGDVVDVRLVEAAPVAGALRFELLSEGTVAPRGRSRRPGAGDTMRAKAKTQPGRSPRKGKAKDKGKSGKSKKGKPFKG